MPVSPINPAREQILSPPAGDLPGESVTGAPSKPLSGQPQSTPSPVEHQLNTRKRKTDQSQAEDQLHARLSKAEDQLHALQTDASRRD